ncbi:MAG: ferritin family protein [Firmicutes bacterium]|nr:ferritin family protein [Bacillota bacterium]
MDKQLAVLSFALGMEREGKDFFTKAAGTARDEEARNVFLDLARMEEGHIAYIQANIDSLNREGKWTPEPVSGLDEDKMREQVFQARGKGKGPEPELPVGEVTTELSALRIALAIENDLYGFYGRAALHATEPDAIAVFQKLAGWEKGHREMLEAQYETMKEDLWSDIGFAPF